MKTKLIFVKVFFYSLLEIKKILSDLLPLIINCFVNIPFIYEHGRSEQNFNYFSIYQIISFDNWPPQIIIL